jgi:hypothetical protein
LRLNRKAFHSKHKDRSWVKGFIHFVGYFGKGRKRPLGERNCKNWSQIRQVHRRPAFREINRQLNGRKQGKRRKEEMTVMMNLSVFIWTVWKIVDAKLI